MSLVGFVLSFEMALSLQPYRKLFLARAGEQTQDLFVSFFS